MGWLGCLRLAFKIIIIIMIKKKEKSAPSLFRGTLHIALFSEQDLITAAAKLPSVSIH